MAEKWESAAIQAIGDRWAAAKNAGASQSVLDAIHREAEKLRAEEGYSGGSSGNKYISTGKKKPGNSGGSVSTVPDRVEIIEDSGESSGDAGFPIYDFGGGTTSSGGDTTGQTILGYIVMFLVGIAILDKIMG